MKNLFNNRNYTLVFLGQATSKFGSNIQQYALSIYILFLTDSASLFVTSMIISTIPSIIFAPVAGVIGDWFDRKRSIITLDLLNGIVLGLFAFGLYIHGEIHVGMIFGLILYLEVIEVFYSASSSGIVPSIVREEELFSANSAMESVKSLSNLLSPVIGTALYAFFGIWLVLIINAISFIFSAILEMLAKIPKTTKMPVKINLKAFSDEIRKGMQIVLKYEVMVTIICIGVLVNLLLGGFSSVGVIYILKEIGITEIKIGYYVSAVFVGSLVGTAILSQIFKHVDAGKLIKRVIAVLILTITLIGLIVTPTMLDMYQSLLIPYFLIMLLGFTMSAVGVLILIVVQTLVQQYIPNDQMGKASAFMGIFISISVPLSLVIVAFLYEVFSISNATFALTLISFIVVIVLRKRITRTHYKVAEEK